MNTVSPEMSFLEFLRDYGALLSGLGGGLAAYVAIRVDLAAHQERIKNAERLAVGAHDRIDDLLNRPRSRVHDSL